MEVARPPFFCNISARRARHIQKPHFGAIDKHLYNPTAPPPWRCWHSIVYDEDGGNANQLTSASVTRTQHAPSSIHSRPLRPRTTKADGIQPRPPRAASHGHDAFGPAIPRPFRAGSGKNSARAAAATKAHSRIGRRPPPPPRRPQPPPESSSSTATAAIAPSVGRHRNRTQKRAPIARPPDPAGGSRDLKSPDLRRHQIIGDDEVLRDGQGDAPALSRWRRRGKALPLPSPQAARVAGACSGGGAAGGGEE
jgi:hypothetical protein